MGENSWSRFDELKELNKIKSLERLPYSSPTDAVGRLFASVNIYGGNRFWPLDQSKVSEFTAKEVGNIPFDVAIPYSYDRKRSHTIAVRTRRSSVLSAQKYDR